MTFDQRLQAIQRLFARIHRAEDENRLTYGLWEELALEILALANPGIPVAEPIISGAPQSDWPDRLAKKLEELRKTSTGSLSEFHARRSTASSS